MVNTYLPGPIFEKQPNAEVQLVQKQRPLYDLVAFDRLFCSVRFKPGCNLRCAPLGCELPERVSLRNGKSMMTSRTNRSAFQQLRHKQYGYASQ